MTEVANMIQEIEAHSRFPTGIGKIGRGECELRARSSAACMFCSYGHLLECHHPLTCEEARCSHWAEAWDDS